MTGSVRLAGVMGFLLAAPSPALMAQFNPYGKSSNSDTAGNEARARRAERERAVAKVGPEARDLVETHGDEAVAAIFTCSKAVGVKLAAFHSSGELGKLPRPRDLLRVIAKPGNGDDVALWAIHHVRELADLDFFDAYLHNPLDYALGLKELAAGAAESRARRLQVTTQTPSTVSRDEKILIAVGLGIFAILAFFAWRRKHVVSD